MFAARVAMAFASSRPSSTPVLLGFCILSFVIGLTWTAFSSVPAVSARLFPSLESAAAVAWTLNANNLAQLLTAPYALWLLASPPSGSTGLRKTMLLASAALLAQSGLWAGATLDASSRWAFAALLVGGVAGGSASAFTQGCVSHLSAAWFPAEARGFATAVACASQYSGQALAFLAALPICAASELSVMLQIEAGIALLLLMLVAAYFPDGPPRPLADEVPALGTTSDPLSEPLCSPSHRAADTGVSAWRTLNARQWVSCLLLGLSTAWLNGFFSAWATTLPLSLRHDGVHAHAHAPAVAAATAADGCEHAAAHEGALLAFAAGVAYPVGGALAGWVADRYFVRRLRTLLLLCLLVASLSYIAMLACRPPAWLAGHGVLGSDRALLAVLAPSVIVAGVAIGGTMPVAFELLAEISHPLPPGSSANAVVGLLQITATINTALAAALSPADMNVVMLSSMLPCACLLWFTHERYGREEQLRVGVMRTAAGGGQQDGDDTQCDRRRA